ncbi:MAG: T9SS type A sorting domain-containing protein [Dysgonomonas sp.]
MKKIQILFIAAISAFIYSLEAQESIQFDYDEAGNCIVKYKTVVLPSHTKRKANDTTQIAPQSEIVSDREVIIYPNPTQGALKIEIKGPNPESPIRYVLTDMGGNTISKAESKEIYYSFDMTSFPPGVYLLRVMIDDKWNTWKIMKE